jgi:hypothetical protein
MTSPTLSGRNFELFSGIPSAEQLCDIAAIHRQGIRGIL